MADENNGFTDMLKNALEDPRFSQILGQLKEKSENGDLNVSDILSNIGSSAERSVKPSQGELPNSEDKGQKDLFHGVDFKKHMNLISALKPYLSEEKQSAVDGILKIGDMSTALEAVMKLK